MNANVITLIRILLTFAVIALFRSHPDLDIVLITTIGLIFILDAVDGVVARCRNQASEVGAILDTVGDRIVESAFWIYFAGVGIIGVWIPIIVISRGIFTDGIKRITPAQAANSNVAQALTSSRTSRSLYGLSKMLTFLYLGNLTAYKHSHPTTEVEPFEKVGIILSVITVCICLIRGIPAFIDGWKSIAYR